MSEFSSAVLSGSASPLAVLTDAQHAMTLHLLAFAAVSPASQAEARGELEEAFPNESAHDREFVAAFYAEHRARIIASLADG